jgi:uncharacterized membrane protein
MSGFLVRMAAAALLGTASLAPTCAGAQTAPPTAPAAGAPAPREIEASLNHSMAKAVTLKIATFTIGIAIYSVGTGNLAAGTALSAINAAGSFVILTANDYGWDYYWPNTNVSANNANFGALASLSRNTVKYLTLKPMLTVLNLGSVYWWTGSVTSAALTGGTAVLVLPLTFYINNTMWDWYDWRTVTK